LDEIVRLVRLTRPEVILTWLPNYVVGENHDDHQAAGVLATEAFDMAGDPTKFPAQITAPRNRVGMMNRTEGLQAWQPKKLYYATDAFEDFGPYWHDKQQLSPFRKNFLDGNGPTYPNTTISPTRHQSYARLMAEQQRYYLTQEGDIGIEAIEKNDLSGFEYPMRLIFGKSLVGGSVTGDVFEGISDVPIRFAPVSGYRRQPSTGVSLGLGGPWAFYREFWKAHDLEHLSKLLPIPEVSTKFGNVLYIPLVLHNAALSEEEVKLTANLPAGWTDKTPYAVYPVKPGESYPVLAMSLTPESGNAQWREISWKAEVGAHVVGTVTMRVFISNEGVLPQ
jgi:hypothetical protein